MNRTKRERSLGFGMACDACRVRKYKCSKDRPVCQLCSENERECHYSERITRSPLTRVYLTSVERRLHKVECLFAELLPDANLEDLLTSSATTSPIQNAAPSPAQSAIARTISTHEESEAFSEALPDNSDGFDWREELTSPGDLADGMASLSIEPTGAGYLGSTSGVVFLRSLMYWTRNSKEVAGSQGDTASSEDPDRIIPILRHSDALIPHHIMGQLVDAYFANYHVSYPFVHEATFRAQYSELIPRPKQQPWEMLLHTILALGAWTLSSEQTDLDEIIYRNTSYLGQDTSIFESASLTVVQALILISNFVQKRNKPNTGWNYLGLAVRMALSLGLHRELPEWNISLLQREMRRRVWWGLFIFDSGASTTFGRAILLPQLDLTDVQQVLNIHDHLLTPKTNFVPSELPEPTIYSGLRAQVGFHLATNHVSNRLLSRAPISAGEALVLNKALESWANTLPPYFQLGQQPTNSDQWYIFARSRLWWRHWNLQIILFRPILLRMSIKTANEEQGSQVDGDEERAKDICLSSAHFTIAHIQNYIEQAPLTRLVAWYSLYFLFHAALISCFCLLTDHKSTQAPSWEADVKTTNDLLDTAFQANPLAARCSSILKRIMESSSSQTNDLWPEILGIDGAEFPVWPADSEDPFFSFGWPDMRQER